MTDWRVVAAQLKAFDDSRQVVKAMRRGIREPVPKIRAAIRERAVETLPHRGGLGAWVAEIKFGANVKINARRVALRIKGGRNSRGGRSDIRAIDRGRVRAPAWGRRSRGSWHSQTVPAGFFSGPAAAAGDDVRQAVDAAVDLALDALRKG